MIQADLSRRSFIKVAAAASGGLMVGACMPAKASAGARAKADGSFGPSVWVSIEPSGQVSITVSKADIGQGVRTGLAMIVADELDVDWKDVKIVQAPAGEEYGDQGVGGSRSTVGLWQTLRQAGAAARNLLLTAAAQSMSVQPGDCRVSNGVVTHPASNKKMSYGELAGLAASLPAPDMSSVKLKDKSEWKIIGKPMKRVDNPLVVSGKAMYAMDVKVPGALTAVVEMPHAFGSSVESVDDSEAKKVPGVKQVLQAPFGIVVVAENTYAALKGRSLLKIKWNLGENASFSTTAMRDAMKAAVQPWGNPIQGASKTIEATYELPYLAHACMEPMNCVVVPESGKATVFIGSQNPQGAQGAVARELGLTPSDVRVNVTLAGGGFGRKGSTDVVSQCAWVAKQVGKPIRLMWTREDDMRHDNYRPSSHHAVRGGLAADGSVAGVEHQMINSGGGGRGGGSYRPTNTWYKLPMQTLGNSVPSPVPNGAWRSVANSQTGFVIESFVDELAHAAGKDPYEFRKENLTNDRVKACLVAAAEKAGWGKPLPQGHARGIACFSGWGSNVAQVAEVSVSPKGQVKVHKVTIAVDCGTEVNPLAVEAQLEGAMIDGITCALKARITVNEGGVVQSNFSDYDWTRFDEAPEIEIVHLPNGSNPGGMGELGVPSAAPAIANAIFAATGKRCRRLPIRPQDLT